MRSPGRALTLSLACLAAAVAAAVAAVVAALHGAGSARGPVSSTARVMAATAPSAPPPIAPPPRPVPAGPSPSAQPPVADGEARMLAALRKAPGVITLRIEDHPAARAIADKLAGLFREAGWTVDESSVFGAGEPERGLSAALGDTPADNAVRAAFDAAGFRFGPPPSAAGVVHEPELFVGPPYDR